MAVDPVPWFIQAPAEHSAEVARTLAYQAIGGKEGLARRGDLTVQALPVPGGAVQVLPGAAGILNRGSGGAGQAYVGRVGSAVSVPIAATGSGAGRSDLIVFRVDDPQYGGAVPPSAENGPYIMLDVVSGVNSTVTRVQDVPGHEADSAVTLARVDLPASTGTVTDAMITNVSSVANPKYALTSRSRPLTTGDAETLTSTAANGQSFPTGFGTHLIQVPEWATRMEITARVAGAKGGAGSAHGAFWVAFGEQATAKFGWNTPNTSDDKDVAMDAWQTVTVTDAMRGAVVPFVLRASVASGVPATARPRVDEWSGVALRIDFFEV